MRIMKEVSQLSIIDAIDLAIRIETPYLNGLGQPLPWEEDEYLKRKENV